MFDVWADFHSISLNSKHSLSLQLSNWNKERKGVKDDQIAWDSFITWDFDRGYANDLVWGIGIAEDREVKIFWLHGVAILQRLSHYCLFPPWNFKIQDQERMNVLPCGIWISFRKLFQSDINISTTCSEIFDGWDNCDRLNIWLTNGLTNRIWTMHRLAISN